MSTEPPISFVSIYKAPQPRLGAKQLAEGFNASDFPEMPPPYEYFPGGVAFFTLDRALAEEFASYFGEGVIEVLVPADVYYGQVPGIAGFSHYQREYLDIPHLVELPIPAARLEDLSRFDRIWHQEKSP